MPGGDIFHFCHTDVSCFRPDRQNLFPIVQGGLDEGMRRQCASELTSRVVPGFAVGGLSGGEAKDLFWRMVHVSTDNLPEDKPRYLVNTLNPQ